MTEEKMESWSMEDLIALTDEVQTAELDYKGKVVNIQWCELIESEEPSMGLPSEGSSEEEKNESVSYTHLTLPTILIV